MTSCGLTWRMTRASSSAQAEVGLQPAVGLGEEHEVVDADLLGRPGLLLAAQRRHLGPAHGVLEATGVAVGDDAVRDVDAPVGQAGDRARGTEVDIVGMGRDDQHPLDLGLVEHGARLPPGSSPGPRPTMRPMDPEHVALAEIDLSDPELWLAPRDHRERVFRTLRDEAPVQFFEEVEFPPFAKGPGYFAITRYEDVWMASRNPQLFCSRPGHGHRRHAARDRRVLRLDDQHGRPAATSACARSCPRASRPRRSARSRGTSATRPTAIVDTPARAVPRRRVRLRRARSPRPLPLQIICEMMGIPAEDEQQIFEWTNIILGVGDPEYGGTLERPDRAQHGHVHRTPRRSARTACANPSDDMTSVLMHAEVDGERLTTPGVRLVLHPARRRRQRDHPQRHQPRDEGAHRAPRPARAAGRTTSTARRQDRGRGDRPLGDARSSTSAAPPPRTPSIGGTPIEGRRQGRAVVQLGQPRRARRSPTRTRFDVTPRRRNRAGRLRRRRPALLPRRQPGPPGDHGDVRGDPPPAARPARSPASPTYLQSDVHQRHQAHALRLEVALSRAGRRGSGGGRGARSGRRRRTAGRSASSVSPTTTTSPS